MVCQLKRYYLEHGEYPETLVAGGISPARNLCHEGGVVEYRRKGKGFRINTIGAAEAGLEKDFVWVQNASGTPRVSSFAGN